MEDKDRFCLIMSYLFKAEGGYSNHKYDKGGVTNYGITQKTYDAFRKKKNLTSQSVVKITKDEAYNLYYEDFWCASGADKIENTALACVLFDACVNHGVALGKSLYLKSDGNINTFLNLRREKYKNIVKNNPTQKVFLKGWLNRIDNLEKFIKNELPKRLSIS